MTATSAELGKPPEFPNVGDPPAKSTPIVLTRTVVPVNVGREPRLRDRLAALQISLSGFVPEVSLDQDSLEQIRSWTEIRRITHERYWHRDKIHQLAKGASLKTTVSLTVGMSRTAAHELTSSLGLEFGATESLPIGLSAALEEKIGYSAALSESATVREELTLENTGDSVRRFAVWSVKNQLTVEALDGVELTRHFEADELQAFADIASVWRGIAVASWIDSNEIHTTSRDDE